MTIEVAKQELINRYKYLYENAVLILGPYVVEKPLEIPKGSLKFRKKTIGDLLLELNINTITYVKIPNEMVSVFEEFLLSATNFKESKLYQMIESLKNDKNYLEKVKKGCLLIEKDNERYPYSGKTLSIYDILGKVRRYLKNQSGDLKNRDNKSLIINEYYQIAGYCNDGTVRYDGDSIIRVDDMAKPSRDKKDIGVHYNEFIEILSKTPCYEDNLSIFLESEKQEVYLQYHDELPWDLEITCEIEEKYKNDMEDKRLVRPEPTNGCGKTFYIDEKEIFVDFNDLIYRYYQLCPHCGYIVNIPNEILTSGIRERIENRCQRDPNLFRKMSLYSELQKLDDISIKGQKRLLKK